MKILSTLLPKKIMLWVILPALNFFFKLFLPFLLKCWRKAPAGFHLLWCWKVSEWWWIQTEAVLNQCTFFKKNFFYFSDVDPTFINRSIMWVLYPSFCSFLQIRLGKTTCIQLAFMIFWVRTDLYAHAYWDFFFSLSPTHQIITSGAKPSDFSKRNMLF